MTFGQVSVCASFAIALCSAAPGGGEYWKAGWTAEMPPGGSGSSGMATIIDETTIRVDCFSYNGLAPLVYFYLGEHDTYDDFLNGLPLGEPLDFADCETVFIDLPPGESLDDWNAISIWCAAADVNFTSGEFSAGPCPGDVNDDDAVGVEDLVFVVLNFGAAGGLADVNEDGIVDVQDLVAVILTWGPCF
jgi:hypothetical protein